MNGVGVYLLCRGVMHLCHPLLHKSIEQGAKRHFVHVAMVRVNGGHRFKRFHTLVLMTVIFIALVVMRVLVIDGTIALSALHHHAHRALVMVMRHHRQCYHQQSHPPNYYVRTNIHHLLSIFIINYPPQR